MAVQSALTAVLGAETAAHHAGSTSFPLLTVMVLLPAIGALLVALVPKTRLELVKVAGLSASLATAAMTVWLLVEFETGGSRPKSRFRSVSMPSMICAKAAASASSPS